LLVGAVAGTIAGRTLDPGLPTATIILLGAACFLIYGFLRLPQRHFIIPLILLVGAAAFFNANRYYRSFPPDDIIRYAGENKNFRFFGEIVKWPVLKRHQTVMACRIDSLVYKKTAEGVSGNIMLMVERETTHFVLGDRVSFTGRLRRPVVGGYPGQFDYQRYLQNKGIRAMVTVADPAYIMIHSRENNWFGRLVGEIRGWINDCFRDNMRQLPSALASGFLIGETRDIPEDVYIAFRRTGTMHLLAVSGSNVALVLLVVIFIIRYIKLQRGARLILLLFVIVIFSHLSYNQPSVVRASIMAALILIAGIFYRRLEMNNIIALAATILIFYDPGNLYDIGFQLSFAVTWGLILFLPYLNRVIIDRDISTVTRYLVLIVFSSLIATLISAPITAYYFGEISLVTVFSNLLVVPLVSAAVVGLAVLLLVELALPALAIIPGMLLDRLLFIIHDLVVWFGKWELSMVGTASISAGRVLFLLIGVVLVLTSISIKRCRWVLLGWTIIGGVYAFFAFVVGPAPGGPDIEVFNWGRRHTVIINRSGGVVIFGDSDGGRSNHFSRNLVDYLYDRDMPLPAYFLFCERRFVTERRLAAVSDRGYDLNLRPIIGNECKSSISVWGCREIEGSRESFGKADFRISGKVVEIRLPESLSILYGNYGDVHKTYSNSDLREFGLVILTIAGITGVFDRQLLEDLPGVILVPDRPLGKLCYNRDLEGKSEQNVYVVSSRSGRVRFCFGTEFTRVSD